MAWVTLAIRKQELIHTHNYLEMEDLRITREERQMARAYALETTRLQNEEAKELRSARESYKAKKDELKAGKGSMDSTEYQNELTDAQEAYQEDQDSIQTYYEGEIQGNEEEASVIEAQYEDSKVQIETQMEAVAAEMDTIKDQISTDIQNEAINLH